MEAMKTPFNSFCWNAFFAALSIISHNTGNPTPAMAMSFVDLMIRKNYKQPWNALTSFLFMMVISNSCPMLCLPLYLLIRLVDTDSIRYRWMTYPVRKILDFFVELEINFAYPMFGVNSTAWLGDLRDHLAASYHEFSEVVIIPAVTCVTALHLNTLHITTPILDTGTTPLKSPTEMLNRYRRSEAAYKKAVVFSLFTLMVMTAGALGFVSAALIFVMWLLQAPTKRYLNRTANRTRIKDGVWRISTEYFGLPMFGGIGVSQNGVLHVPYHVCNAQPILIGDHTYEPFFVDGDLDLVTYGGPPNLVTPNPDDDVYICLQNDISVTTYYLGKNINVEENSISFPSLTSPGQSGSPVVIQRKVEDTTVLYLAGLAGRYVAIGDTRTEFSMSVTEEKKRYKKIVTHPGSGKTRTILPELIRQALHDHPTRKVLVSGPTVIVCREIAKAMEINKIKYGMNVKGGHPNKSAPVQIAAHRTMIGLITSKALNNYQTLILDEAHCDQASTRMLRTYGNYMVKQGLCFTEMSATLDEDCDGKSNYQIDDVEIMESEVVSKVISLIEEGKRVLLFVTSFKGNTARSYLKQLQKFNPIKLSRATLDMAYKSLPDLNYRLIITTDIAEVGINIPDLDAVVDPSQSFKYTNDNGIVSGHVIPVTKASMVQRRGRVGRDKPGAYYYIRRGHQSHKTSEESDAEILSHGRTWNSDSKIPPFSLTQAQFTHWVDSDYTPFRIFLMYDANGNARDPNVPSHRTEIMNLLSSFKPTDPLIPAGTYTGCGGMNCPCNGFYTYYDDRDHDYVFKTQTPLDL